VNVTANIETVSLAQGGTSVAAKAKTFDEPQQAFSDSLSAVSKATSQTDSRDDGNTKATSRKKSTSEDTESTSSADQSSTARSSVVSQFVTQPEQAVPVQQTPVSASSGNLSGKTVAIADTKAEKAVQSSTAESSDDPSQTASLVAGPTAQKVEASGVPLSEAANSVSDVDANGVTNTTTNARSIENSSAVANASADASVDADSSMNANGIRNLAQNAILNGALSAVRSAVTVETAPGVSAGMASNSAAGNASANQVTPSAIVSEQTLPATTTDTSASVSNQIASLNKTGDESSVAIRAGVSNFKLASTAKSSVTSAADGKTVSKDTTTDATSAATGSVKHKITADQSESQTGAQQNTSSGDQSQSGASSQGQNAVSFQTNYANHQAAAMVQPQSTVSALLTPSTSQHAGTTSSAVSSPLTTASASDGLVQSSSAINSAKLINTMGQSEMRVGMRSDEFGTISISTTSSKDVITTQISLDHGELAKTLAAQLPEMQARLGSSQTVNVHIDMNSSGAGQGTDTSGNTANSSSNQSHRDGQQSTYAASSYGSNSIVESQLSPVIATATSGYGSANSRLDIRV